MGRIMGASDVFVFCSYRITMYDISLCSIQELITRWQVVGSVSVAHNVAVSIFFILWTNYWPEHQTNSTLIWLSHNSLAYKMSSSDALNPDAFMQQMSQLWDFLLMQSVSGAFYCTRDSSIFRIAAVFLPRSIEYQVFPQLFSEFNGFIFKVNRIRSCNRRIAILLWFWS